MMDNDSDDQSRDSPEVRKPRRMPKYLADHSDGEDSNSVTSAGRRRLGEAEEDFKSLQSMLRDTIKLKPNEELIIYEEDVTEQGIAGSDDEGTDVQVMEVDEEEVNRIGRDNFQPLVEEEGDIISTRPVIRVKKVKHLTLKRLSKIKVPPSNIDETLHERFNAIQNKVVKRHITPYFHMINYLKWKQESGMANIKKTLEMAKKLKNQAIMTANGANTVAGKLAKINQGNSVEEHMAFWEEQMDYWAKMFRWYKEDDKRHMTRAELDAEIEQYMINRGFVPTDDKDMLDQELADYMAKKGIIRERTEEELLDDELDAFVASKGMNGTANGTAINGSTVNQREQQILDDDLNSFISQSSKRTATRAATQPISLEDLDNELDSYIAGTGSVQAGSTSKSRVEHMRELDEELAVYQNGPNEEMFEF